MPPGQLRARASRPRSRPSSCARWRRTRRGATRAPRSSSRRSRTRAARRPAPVVAEPASPSTRSRARAGGCGRWWRSRWPRSPSARTSCSPATGRRARTSSGARPSEAADILHERGLEIAFVDARVRRRPARRGDLAGPRGRRGGPRGLDRHARSPAAGARCRCPPSRASREDDAEQALEDAGFKTKIEEAFSDSVPEGDVISHLAGGRHARRPRAARSRSRSRKGATGVAVPKLVGLQQRRGRGRSSRAAGLTADVTEQETTQPPGTVMEQDPPAGTRVDEGATVELTVAKARPEVPGRDDRPPDGRGGHRDARGGRLQGRRRARRPDPALRRARDRPVARSRARRAPPARRSRSTSARTPARRRRRRRPTPTPTP